MRVFLGVLLAAIWGVPAYAEPSLSPASAAQLDEGLRRLYALDYDAARAAFHRVIEIEPDSPFGYLFEAGGLWWQASQEGGLFESSPVLKKFFLQDIEAALKRAARLMQSTNPKTQADGYFASGMALGTRGQWLLLHHHYLDAYFDGHKAVKHLKKCLKLDKNYIEAQLGLGVYDYETAHLSGVARLGVLVGMKGNEKRGIASLRAAMEHSRYARHQAAEFLVTIYLSDLDDPVQALPILHRLSADIPESPYFLLLETLARHRLHDRDGSLALGREFARRAAADPGGFAPKWLSLVCGLADSEQDCLVRGDVEETLAWLDDALDAKEQNPPDPGVAVLRLLRAHALDILDHRAAAQEEYRRVLALPASSRLHERAKACLDAPCGRRPLLRWMREQAGLGPT